MAAQLSRRELFAGMAAALAVAPAAAHAQAQPAVRVPINNAQDVEPRAVQFSAAQVSKGALVLAVYSSNKFVTDAAIQAAADVRAAGIPLKGVILGPAEIKPGAASAVEFYVDAQCATTITNARPDAAEFRREIVRLYKEVLSPRLIAARGPGPSGP